MSDDTCFTWSSEKAAQYTLRPEPEYSDWECYMFGSPIGGPGSYLWRPLKGREPHRLARWAMRVFFDCRWVKKPPSPSSPA